MTGPQDAAVDAASAVPRAMRLLVATVGGEWIALPAAEVLEVIDAPQIAPVPLAPAGLLGQCLWRERTLAVLDAHVLSGVPRTGSPVPDPLRAAEGVLLVMHGTSGLIALRVDDVEHVLDVDPATVREVPPGIDRVGRVGALLRVGAGLVAVLDLGVLRVAAEAILRGGEPA